MAGPVSAFARRRAAQTVHSVLATPTEASVEVTTHVNDDGEASTPRKKRRKKRDSSQAVIAVPTSPLDVVVSRDIANGDNGRHIQSSDSSDIEGNEEPEIIESTDEILPTISEISERKLSTFSAKRSTVLKDTDSEWRIRLHPQDKLAIVGQYDLWIRSGAVSIFGAVLHASSTLHRVYAPSTHSIPSVRSVPNPYGTGNPPCEISINTCKSRLRSLSQLAPKFSRIWNSEEQATVKRSFIDLHNSVDDPYKRPLQLLEAPSDWWAMVSKLVAKDRATAMVCGPKGAGKSTFCRMLANAHLTHRSAQQKKRRLPQLDDYVAFLDLDPGQPEYSPPGELSLHKVRTCNLGPSFAHPMPNGSNEVVRAHHFGHLSPKEDPHHYYRCAVDLFSHYKQISADRTQCPLVINCSGWVQGSGLDFLDHFIRNLDLTDVVYMSTAGPEEVVDTLSQATTKSDIQLHQLNSHASEVTTRTAADFRVMQTLSYFHMDEPEGGNLRWNSSPMACQLPTIVRYAGPTQDILATTVLGDEQSPEFLESLLEGSIVGVVAIDDDLAFNESQMSSHDSLPRLIHSLGTDHNGTVDDAASNECKYTQDRSINQGYHETKPRRILRTPTDIPYLAPLHHRTQSLPPGNSRSLGQALIRGIDSKTKTFHLSTPIPQTTIRAILKDGRHRIILVRGKLDTPTWAYAERLEFEKARRRRLESNLDAEHDFWPEDVRVWADGQPWASAVDGGRTGSGKVRRVRRDIRYKGQNDGPGRE